MRVYIVHPSDKSRRLQEQRVNVYDCNLEKVAEIIKPKRHIALYKRVMGQIGSRGIRVVLTDLERGLPDDGSA